MVTRCNVCRALDDGQKFLFTNSHSLIRGISEKTLVVLFSGGARIFRLLGTGYTRILTGHIQKTMRSLPCYGSLSSAGTQLFPAGARAPARPGLTPPLVPLQTNFAR